MTSTESRISIATYLGPADIAATLCDDVRAGLTSRPLSIPPKWFYDDRGSDLFDEITRLPEYYPTEAERAALGLAAAEIVALTGAATIVELGSGSSDKTTTLLDAFGDAGHLERYVPIDVSGSALRSAAEYLAERYPALVVEGIVGDFDRHLSAIPDGERAGDRLVIFLGGTIGNYAPAPRGRLLRDIAAALEPGDHLLLGTDLVKDAGRLVAAYDDSAGVTAAFNRNVLSVVNRELGADFDPDRFDHVALWDSEREWIEMRLRSTAEQRVEVLALGISCDVAAGEEILTEISAKFRPDGLRTELVGAGFEVVRAWTDPAGDFAITLATRAGS